LLVCDSAYLEKGDLVAFLCLLVVFVGCTIVAVVLGNSSSSLIIPYFFVILLVVFSCPKSVLSLSLLFGVGVVLVELRFNLR